MFMEEQDKAFFTQLLLTHSAEVQGKFDVINVKLESIIEQTTKTNGRVNKLEYKTIPEINEKISKISLNEINHVVNCPQLSRLKVLEDNLTSQKSIKKFLITTVTLSGIISGIIYGLIKLFTGQG